MDDNGAANVSYNDILAAFKAHTPVYLDYEADTNTGTIAAFASCFGVRHGTDGYEALFAISNLLSPDPVGVILQANTADEMLFKGLS